MRLKQIIDESYGDYKECSMLLVTATCSFKCPGCQNRHLELLETREFDNNDILTRFEKNPLSKAIVFGGLEPFDQIPELVWFFKDANLRGFDIPIIIYTGYDNKLTSIDMYNLCQEIRRYRGKVIIKYGSYQPDRSSYFNYDLGITLVGLNQYTVCYNTEPR